MKRNLRKRKPPARPRGRRAGNGRCANLDRIARDCAAGDWDGEGAVGVSGEVVESARRFVRMLPEDCLPDSEEDVEVDIEADVDGEILLDWFGDENRMFTASVGKGGRVAYAGTFADGEGCRGKESIDGGEIPEAMLASIRRTLAAPAGTAAARRGATDRET